jgi:SOS-response transcriptional repressor LexA
MIQTTAILLENESTLKADSFAERIKFILEQQKRTLAWLADEIGISKQAMNYMLKHSAKPKYVSEIALALVINPEWLKTGEGSITLSSVKNNGARQIPLIDMNSSSLIHPNENSRSDIIVSDELSDKCFAVILDSPCMAPLFQIGSILIFDPGRQVKNGDYVLIKIEESNEILFRQYFKDGNDIIFKAVDIQFKTVKDKAFTIYGILVESRNQF